ncbi:MAG: helix-turn-helix domain-containing protein, partial [Bacteroidota bacterium]
RARMVINKQNIRLIFGLKLKQLRVQKGLSFAQLSKVAGVSVSYLNEIEKGKKYPKTDKIIALAAALEVPYDQLVSLKLNRKLAPIAELLNSGILDSLPLEMFGLDPSTLLELISAAPTKINAFISTILKVARNYELSQENFYFAALRSYQEMHDNYFEDLELAVDRFRAEYEADASPELDHAWMVNCLKSHYGYQIDEHTIQDYSELKGFRSVYLPEQKRLMINPSLTNTQKSFLLGKEIGFNYLRLEERPTTSNLFEVHSFEEVLNNFKAAYFSVALLIDRASLKADLGGFFAQSDWEPGKLLDLMSKYQASPEMFLHRLSNLLPKHFGIDNFFFLRFNDYFDREIDNFHITKELHLSQLHNPHRNDLNEHYCRRWIAIGILEDLKRHDLDDAGTYLVKAQRSRYLTNKQEYLCLSIAKPGFPSPSTNVSVTLGIKIDAISRRRIKFLEHDSVPLRDVNETCERCPLVDCQDRAAEPSVVQRRNEQEAIKRKLASLSEGFEKLSAKD